MPEFDSGCVDCPRLASYLSHMRECYPHYYGQPVPPFGDPGAHLLVVGLAPGKHGANASGRPFTGDYAGILLYQTLHKFGFADRPASLSAKDGLILKNCRITNAVKCLPPENKPTIKEIRNCNRYLQTELETLVAGSVIVALGRIAHQAVIYALRQKQNEFAFAHGAHHALPNGLYLVDSYHCSRYNTQTRRLTAAMFEKIFIKAGELLNGTPPAS